jgi:hypothetical protein
MSQTRQGAFPAPATVNLQELQCNQVHKPLYLPCVLPRVLPCVLPYVLPRAGSARKLGHVLVEALNARRAEAGAAVSGGVTVTAGEAGLV